VTLEDVLSHLVAEIDELTTDAGLTTREPLTRVPYPTSW